MTRTYIKEGDSRKRHEVRIQFVQLDRERDDLPGAQWRDMVTLQIFACTYSGEAMLNEPYEKTLELGQSATLVIED